MALGEALGHLAKIALGLSTLRAGARGLASLASDRAVSRATGQIGEPVARRHPVRRVDDRVAVVTDLIRRWGADPRVREVAASMLTRRCGTRQDGQTEWCVPEKDARAEVIAIFGEVRRRVRYGRDTWGTDVYQAPLRTLKTGHGDCASYVILLAALLRSVGYPTMLHVVQTKKAADFDHIFLSVGLPPARPTEWMALDASVDRPAGWRPPAHMIRRERRFVP